MDGDHAGVEASEEGGDELGARRVDEDRSPPLEVAQVRGDGAGLAVELAEGQLRRDGLAVGQERERDGVRTLACVLGEDLREGELPSGAGRLATPAALCGRSATARAR
jgi:hypothetical protein